MTYLKPRKVKDINAYMHLCEMERLVRQIKLSMNLATVRAQMIVGSK